MSLTFDTFNLKSPYRRFDKDALQKNVEVANWQYSDSVPTFNKFITELRPDVIIELGSWKGWSAIQMAKICRQRNLNTKILCVDTWLGSEEHWRTDKCNSLHEFSNFENGTSAIFDLFCKNVISNDVEDYIIPLPNTTATMARLFSHLGIMAQMIYVDASHTRQDVFTDLETYYKFLSAGGCIFGDDVCWPEVLAGAEDFAQSQSLSLQFTPNKNLYYFIK